VTVDPSPDEEQSEHGGEDNREGGPEGGGGTDGAARARGRGAPRPTLNAAVRRRRADRAFYIRIAGAIRQNERALERLKR
jgi:hypothetical protein